MHYVFTIVSEDLFTSRSPEITILSGAGRYHRGIRYIGGASSSGNSCSYRQGGLETRVGSAAFIERKR